jgi:hypothetical protein
MLGGQRKGGGKRAFVCRLGRAVEGILSFGSKLQTGPIEVESISQKVIEIE